MLKPERVTFSVDDENYQFANSDQLNSSLNDSLVHYSTDFKRIDQQELSSVENSNSLDQYSSNTMSSQEQPQQTEHEPSTQSLPSHSEEVPVILNETNLHELDALTLQQMAIGPHQNLSNTSDVDNKTGSTHTVSYADIQKEIDRVRQMRYSRTHSSPTTSLCSRITINPFSSSNNSNDINLTTMTQSVHFTDQSNQNNYLPFSPTFITSIPESIVPASTSNNNHFIPIHHRLESPSLEDHEVFETFHTKQASSVPGVAVRQLSRNMSTSETDLIASLHRSASKQGLDNQSEHGTTCSGVSDDVLFAEWDKERSLFQDYINSLRTEIHVLLQERSEYQKQIEAINSNLDEHKRFNLTQVTADQTKFDLLKKSLEEKNLVLEQLQKEYEIVKEKNANLTRKISVLRCDAKAQTGVIDELKQKIAELTVDIQNQIIIKRRLEISMANAENDCKMIDTDRARLINEIKEIHTSKQELEKSLQQANVKIAEQGSTIEMLRSDNIQIRSQLSTTQRRMLQEKQQVMDYLRQIENDLVEKEQIKQREANLRKDYEKLQLTHKQDRLEIDQLNLQIYQDKQKLDQLEQERLNLFKTIQHMDDNKAQLESDLDSYKSATKRLYTHFKIPFDSIQSIDQLIPMLDDRYRLGQASQARIHDVSLVKSADSSHEHEAEENQRLRQDLAAMNLQVKQLNEANQAWQQYQINQNIILRDRLNLANTDNQSFDDIVQEIENRFTVLNRQLAELQQTTKIDDIYQSKQTQTTSDDASDHQRKDESAELPVPVVAADNRQYEETLRQIQENYNNLTVKCSQLDEANRAWQEYHQTQFDNFRTRLQISLPPEINLNLDDVAQYMNEYVEKLQNECKALTQNLQTSERLINDLRTEIESTTETLKQSFTITIDELNNKLVMLKEKYDQLETEKEMLNQQLEYQRTIQIQPIQATPSESRVPDVEAVDELKSTTAQETHVQTALPSPSEYTTSDAREQELEQLRNTVTFLTNQCAQLDAANQAWAAFQQSQITDFRSQLRDHFNVDENVSFDVLAQHMVDQLLKEREDHNERYQSLERSIDELRLESETNAQKIEDTYTKKMNEMNQDLLLMKIQYEELDAEKQTLKQELEKTTTSEHSNEPQPLADEPQIILPRTFEELPIQKTDFNVTNLTEELQQLRDTVTFLTNQCTQLDEANRAWQLYQQTQLDTFRNTFQNYLPIDDTFNLDQATQSLLENINKQRDDLTQRCQALDKLNHDLRAESENNLQTIKESYTNAIDELNRELLFMKEQYEQANELKSSNLLQQQQQEQPFDESPLATSSADADQQDLQEEIRQLRENLVSVSSELDEWKRARYQFEQAQLDMLRNRLQQFLSIDNESSFDEIVQQIVDGLTNQRADFDDNHASLKKANDDLRSELTNNMESIRESYVNTVNELNQELLIMKKEYEEASIDNERLKRELEERCTMMSAVAVEEPAEKVLSISLKESSDEAVVDGHVGSEDAHVNEVDELRERVVFLTNECHQLGEANRAWQQYLQNQLEEFRSKLQDYFPFDENTPFDTLAQQIAEQVSKEREDFNKLSQSMQKATEEIRAESRAQIESTEEECRKRIDELNQASLLLKIECDELQLENNLLKDQLKETTMVTKEEIPEHSIEKVSVTSLKQAFEEVPIHTSSTTLVEVQELRETITRLQNQCAQLEEVNRSWELYQKTQIDSLRCIFEEYVPIDNSMTLDELARQVLDRINTEKEGFNEKCQVLMDEKESIRSESITNLESIKESYINAIDELNKEILGIREQYELSMAEKLALTNELEKKCAELMQEQNKETISGESASLTVPTEVSPDTADINFQETMEELQQLRENYSLLTVQNEELNNANRAWLEFHQSQVDDFRQRLPSFIKVDDNLSFQQMVEKVFEQVVQAHTYLNEQYQALDQSYNDLRLESNQNKEELLRLKENFGKLNEEKQELFKQIESQLTIINDERNAYELLKTNLIEQQNEMSQLTESINSLTAQLNETDLKQQEFKQTQFDLLKTILPNSTAPNLEDIVQEIILHLTNLMKDIDSYKQNELQQTENLQHVNAQCEQLKEHNKQLLEEKLNTNDEQIVFLQGQCAQLDAANRSWQLFYDNQVQSLQDKLRDHIEIDNNSNFDQMTQSIVEKFEQQKQIYANVPLDITKDDLDLLKQELIKSKDNEQVLSQQLTVLEEKLQEKQSSIDALNSDLQLALTECEQLREQHNLLIQQTQVNNIEEPLSTGKPDNTAKQMVQKEIHQAPIHEVQIHRLTPVRSTFSPSIEEELHQLRADLAASSSNCKQLEEANRAWQQYHQNQLDLCRHQLQNFLPLDDNHTLEQITQQLIVYFEQLEKSKQNDDQSDSSSIIASMRKQLADYQLNESMLSETLERLNGKLIQVSHEYDEMRDHHSKLLLSNQQLEQQLNEQRKQIEEYQSLKYDSEQCFALQKENDALNLEKQQLQLKLNEIEQHRNQLHEHHTVERVDLDRDSVPIHDIDQERDKEIVQLRADLSTATARCFELEEANCAWQSYQVEQLESLRKTLQEYIPSLNQIELPSLDVIQQQILDCLSQLNTERGNLIQHNALLMEEIRVQKQQIERPPSTDGVQRVARQHQMHHSILTEPQIHQLTPTQSPSPSSNEHENELQQLRDTVTFLTNQCTQLDEANRAWQLYQQTQLDTFRNTFQNYLPIDDTFNLDQATQYLLENINKQRDDLTQRCQALDKLNHDLRAESENNLQTIKESYTNAIDELNRELLFMKEQYEQANELKSSNLLQQQQQQEQPFDESPLATSSADADQQDLQEEIRQLRENLVSVSSELDEWKRARYQFEQAQLDMLRNRLQQFLSIDNESSFDEIVQQIVDGLTKQRADFDENHASLKKANDDLRSELTNNMESIRESYVNTVNELNQELLIMKKEYEEASIDNERLKRELEERCTMMSAVAVEEPAEKVLSISLKESSDEAVVDGHVGSEDAHVNEVDELRERVVFLTNECHQLGEANRAWQQYLQNQLEEFRSKLQDYFPFDENTPFDTLAQQIAEQVSKEREDFNERFHAIEKANSVLGFDSTNDLESIRLSYMNTVNELNQELIIVKDMCEQLNAENQLLRTELGQRSSETQRVPTPEIIEEVPLNALKQSFEEVPIHATGIDRETERAELEQLRENMTFLTSQCAQLEEANRAWQAYQQSQIHDFRSKLHEYIPFDENVSFDTLAQHIVNEIIKEREDFNTQYEALEKELVEVRQGMLPSVDMNHVNELNEQLLSAKEECEKVHAEKLALISLLESKSTTIIESEQSESIIEKIPQEQDALKESSAEDSVHMIETDIKADDGSEIEKLRETIAVLTSQYEQLDETNRTRQQDQQIQLNDFRNILHDYIPMDDNMQLHDIAQHIIKHLVKDHVNSDEQTETMNDDHRQELTSNIQTLEHFLTDDIEVLNRELIELKNQNEELEKLNKQHLLEKESLLNSFDDRSIILGHHSASELNVIQEENSAEVGKDGDVQAISLSNETEEINQIRADLALMTNQFHQLLQANQNDLDSFRLKIQKFIPISVNATLDEIAALLNDELEQHSSQKNVQKVDHEMQTIETSEKVHMSMQTIPVLYDNHQTQVDRIETIDQHIQTESFQKLWTISDDDSIFHTNEDDSHVQDYIDEISSLSSNELVDRLSTECKQILTKKNLSSLSNENFQLNHLALLSIYLLYNQHLTDDAKQLYSETMIRALKQEYELIHNEKNDSIERYNYLEEKYFNEIKLHEKKYDDLQMKYDELLEQNELERLDSKQSLNELNEKCDACIKQYEFNLYSLHQENESLKFSLNNLQDKYMKLSEKDYGQLEVEYQQLREDYNTVVNENEVLKDYNSQIYQRNLLDAVDMKSFSEVDVQCNLFEELESTIAAEALLQNKEFKQEKLFSEDEIVRLEGIISNIQRENECLRDLNSQYYMEKLQSAPTDSTASVPPVVDIPHSLKPITHGEYLQTENKPEQHEKIAFDDAENDWNDNIEIQMQEVLATEHTISSTVDPEALTNEQIHDSLSQTNAELKNALQSVKDKLDQAVMDCPELFESTNEDTFERLDHLTNVIKNQTLEIEKLKHEVQSTIVLSSQQNIQNNEYQEEIESLKNERDRLIEENKQLEASSKLHADKVLTADHEAKMDENSQDKLTQTNKKLKRALQTIKDKLHHIVDEYPDWFENTTEDTFERLNQIVTFIKNQNQKIHELHMTSTQAQNEIQELKRELDAAQSPTQYSDKPQRQQHLPFSITSQQNSRENETEHEDGQTQNLQHQLSVSNDESTALRDHLQQVQLQLQSASDERDALIQEYTQNTKQKQQEIEDLQQELNQMKQSIAESQAQRYCEEDIESLQNIIDQQSNELKDLTEKCRTLASEIELFEKISKLKEESDEKVKNYENQIQQLLQEHANLVDALEKKTSAPSQDSIDDSDKLIKVNSKLRRALQTIKEKLQRVATQQPELFADVGEDTNERLDHLISLVESQTKDMDRLQAEHLQATSPSDSEEIIQSLKDTISQQTQELQQLNENYLSVLSQLEQHVNAQSAFEQQRKDADDRLAGYEKTIEQLDDERRRLMEDLQRTTSSPMATSESEKISDDKLIKVNSKLRRALQSLKEKLHRVAIDRSDLFVNVGEDTNERLDHLISLVEQQPAGRDMLDNEREISEKGFGTRMGDMENTEATTHHKIDDECSIQNQNLVLTTPPSDETYNQSNVNNYEKQIEELRRQLSHSNDERISTVSMYEEQLQSLIAERDALVQQLIAHDAEKPVDSLQSQQQLTAQPDSEEIIQSLKGTISQQTQELQQLNENYLSVLSQLEQHVNAQSAFEQQRKDADDRLASYEKTIEQLNDERRRLMEDLQRTTSSPMATSESEKISDDKLIKVNSKLRRALQSLKEKLHRVAIDRSHLFVNVGEDTNERLDHLISLMDHQSAEISRLQLELDQVKEQAAVQPPDIDRSNVANYEKQVDELQRKLSHCNDERGLLRERLNEVELEHRNMLDDRTSTLSMYEEQLQSLIAERDALVQQLTAHDAEKPVDSLQSQQQLTGQPDSEEIIQSLKDSITQQTQELQQLNHNYLSVLYQLEQHVNAQAALEQQRKDADDRLASYEKTIEQLNDERRRLMEDLQRTTSSPMATSESEKISDDKLIKVNSKLRRALQSFKEKLQRVAIDRSDLFVNVGEDTNERLDHLISLVEHQSTEIARLEEERYEGVELLAIAPEKVERTSANGLHLNPIHPSQQNITVSNDDSTALREHLHQAELQLQSASDERDALIQEYTQNTKQKQQEIEDLQQELNQMKQSIAESQAQRYCEEDIESLQNIIDQQSNELKDLADKCHTFATRMEILDELKQQKEESDEKVKNYENQIQQLLQEHANLVDALEKKTSAPSQDSIDDSDKLIKVNSKLRRALQTIKEKLQRVATQQPELFADVGEDTNERLDHLISLVESQTKDIDRLQAEHLQATSPSDSEEIIQSLKDSITQQTQELQQLNHNYLSVLYQLEQHVNAQAAFEQQRKDADDRLASYEKTIEQLNDERRRLMEDLQRTTSSPMATSESEKISDDKLIKVNSKLRRALQSFKEKLHRVATDRSDLFVNVGEDTNERLDHLISLMDHQSGEISRLQLELDQVKEQTAVQRQEIDRGSNVANYEKQVDELQRKLSHCNDERGLLRERLNEVELEHRNMLDDRTSTLSMYEEQLQSLMAERDALVQQLAAHDAEKPVDSLQLQQQFTSPSDSEEIIQSLKDTISQRTQELTQLNHNYLSVLSQLDQYVNAQSVFEQQRKDADDRLASYEKTIEQLNDERRRLMEDLQRTTSSPMATSESEKISDDKLIKVNSKLRRALQSLKEKLHRVAIDRSDLFVNVGEDTNERLDHLISLVEHQSTEIARLHSDRDELWKQCNAKIQTLERSLESCRYELESGNRILTQQLVGSSAPEDDQRNGSTIDRSEKEIEELRDELSRSIRERNLLGERLNQVEVECRRILDEQKSMISLHEGQMQSLMQERKDLVEEHNLRLIESCERIAQLEEEIKQLSRSEQNLRDANDKIKSLGEIIEQQSLQLKQLNDKYDAITLAQLESQAEVDRQRQETEQKTVGFDHQIQELMDERARLLEEINRNTLVANEAVEARKEKDDKLTKINSKLKRTLQSMKDKIQRLASEQPDLFMNVGEDTNERLDHLIVLLENQRKQIDALQAARHEIEQQCQHEVDLLKATYDRYREELEKEYHLKFNDARKFDEERKQSETRNDNQWNDWGEQISPIQFPPKEHSLPERSNVALSLNDDLQAKVSDVISQYPDLFPNSNNDIFEVLDQLIFTNKTYQNQIEDLRSLSIVEDYERQISELKDKLHQSSLTCQELQENQLRSSHSSNTTESQTNLDDDSQLIESRLTEFQSQVDTLLRERALLMEQVVQLSHSPTQQHVEIQTENNQNESSLMRSEQRVSRRMFEQEILAWSKESEQLKQFVKQIQIENKKLRDIILKFETMIQEYMHENERLRQENQHLSFLSYSPKETIENNENFASSDMDICYLTLKCLTFEVAQRTSNNNINEQTSVVIDNNEPYLKQRLHDTERQLKSIRIQNQRLKKHTETYTIQLKHIQHELNSKIQELTTLKVEIDRLRTSETQYRLEVERLQADLQCNQVKFQQFEREITELKRGQANNDGSSINALRELLDLKERELKALKEKLDYTIQAHQHELQEAIKANQFSFDNVQRFEQLDQQHQEKRRGLEERLGKFCKLIKPLLENQQLFREKSQINELQELIEETEAEEKVTASLGPIRACLNLLELQMRELHHNLIENHASRSKRWKYKLGFECASCETRWEVTHDIRDLQEACQDPVMFMEASRVEPMMRCTCPIVVDFVEDDVRLCIDDMLDEVVITTVAK